MNPRTALLAATTTLVFVACEPPPPAPEPAPPAWVYAPPPTLWQQVPVRGRLGRSQAPQLVDALGIVGDVRVPLSRPTPWTVPGDGPVRAVVSGSEGVKPAVELIDVDAGRVLWRDTTHCAAPVVGVTATVVVCADAKGTRALALDGTPRWRLDAPFVAMTDDRVVVGSGPAAVVIDAADGSELARLELPAGTVAEDILAACGDAGRELFALQQDRLVRIAEARGGPAVTWSAPMGAVVAFEGCTGDSILATTPTPTGNALVALARATGTQTGRLDGVLGHWRARDGSERIEVALASGLERHARSLATPPEPVEPRVYGELVAERGAWRLVRTSPQTAVLLDERGVHAYLPLVAMGAVIGTRTLLASSWTGSPTESVRRIAIPPRYRKQLRLPARRGPVAVPAELRDLPPNAPLDLATAIDKPDTGKHAIAALALDPAAPHLLYAASLERAPDDTAGASVASVDLAKRAWRWQRADGCGMGMPIALAVAHEIVACAARTTNPANPPLATVRATTHDGAARWEWEGVHVDAIEAAGDIVAVHDANILHVLDGRTGRVRERIASDDGGPVRAALVTHTHDETGSVVEHVSAPTTYLVTAERGRVVVRVPVLEGIAVWSIAVDGVVRDLARLDGGVHVALEDGDAYRIDLETAAVVALPGLNLAWSALGDVIGGAAVGGPIPNLAKPAPPPPVVRDRYGRVLDCVRFRLLPACRAAAAGRPVAPPRRRPARAAVRRRVDPRNPIAPGEPDGPRLWKPIEALPPLGDSWQLALYDGATGAVRARNDYALLGDIALSSVRGPIGSPLVVASGEGLREVLVLDPRNGDPLQRVQLPETAMPGLVFGTVVDGTPIAGGVLASPLRVVVF